MVNLSFFFQDYFKKKAEKTPDELAAYNLAQKLKMRKWRAEKKRLGNKLTVIHVQECL